MRVTQPPPPSHQPFLPQAAFWTYGVTIHLPTAGSYFWHCPHFGIGVGEIGTVAVPHDAPFAMHVAVCGHQYNPLPQVVELHGVPIIRQLLELGHQNWFAKQLTGELAVPEQSGIPKFCQLLEASLPAFGFQANRLISICRHCCSIPAMYVVYSASVRLKMYDDCVAPLLNVHVWRIQFAFCMPPVEHVDPLTMHE